MYFIIYYSRNTNVNVVALIMATIITLRVGQLQSNCYLVSFDRLTPKEVPSIIIDPGDDADLIIQTLQENKLKPIAIIATHGHFDHVMAAFELQEAFNIPFYIHFKDRFLLERLSQTASHFLGRNVVAIPPTQIEAIHNIQLKYTNFKLRIIDTPGHTPGGISIYFPDEKTVFVGDLMFAGGGYGRTDFTYCSQEDLIKSINKIFKLPGQTKILSGHGEPTTVRAEKQFY